jgi:uncharacterized protein YcfL
MKKFLAIAVIAVSLVACNDDASSTTETKDTSTVVTTPTPDTTQVVTTTEVTTDTNHVEGKDTTNNNQNH